MDAGSPPNAFGFDVGRRYERLHRRWDESTAFTSDFSVLIQGADASSSPERRYPHTVG